MEELKEKTSDVLYENYRSDKLMSMGVEQDQTVFKEVKYRSPTYFFLRLYTDGVLVLQ